MYLEPKWLRWHTVLDSVPSQVTFARSSSALARAAPHEERKKEAAVEASRQAISMLIASRRQNGSNRRR